MIINLHCWNGIYETILNYITPLTELKSPWQCFRVGRYVAFQKRIEIRSNPNLLKLVLL